MRLPFPLSVRLSTRPAALLWISLALHSMPSGAAAQEAAHEPSPSLKQADAAYREGVEAMNRNDLPAAQAKFEIVVHLAPSVEPGHSALGTVLLREGQLQAGIRELQKALSIQPGDASAQLNLALAYVQSNSPAKSLPLFAKLEAAAKAQRRALPVNVVASYASALAAEGNAAGAAAKMREAVANDSRNAELHDQLGSLYAKELKWEQAKPEFEEAIRLKPDFAGAHLHLGFVLQAEQKPGASSEWLEANRLAPGDATIALETGKALASAGQDDDAIHIMEHAHQLAPESTAVAYQLALSLQRTNRVAEAIPLLRSVVAAEPKNSDALINLGLALSQQHDAKDALPFLQQAVALRPDNATAHQDLAAADVQINQVDDAIGELKAALKLAPDSPQMHYDLGVAYKLQDDPTDAIPELETAAKLDKTAYEPQYVLGLMYMQVGRYADAATELEASLQLHPDNGDAWATLGSVYSKLDRLPEAASALREAIRRLPDQADPHLTLAAVLVKQNESAEAAEERKVAATLMRAHMNLQRAEVATHSGESALASGKLDDAIVQFREALSFDPAFAEAHLGLSEALEKQGTAAEAEAERGQAKSLTNHPQ